MDIVQALPAGTQNTLMVLLNPGRRREGDGMVL
jgi:hypothetical protein